MQIVFSFFFLSRWGQAWRGLGAGHISPGAEEVVAVEVVFSGSFLSFKGWVDVRYPYLRRPLWSCLSFQNGRNIQPWERQTAARSAGQERRTLAEKPGFFLDVSKTFCEKALSCRAPRLLSSLLCGGWRDSRWGPSVKRVSSVLRRESKWLCVGALHFAV